MSSIRGKLLLAMCFAASALAVASESEEHAEEAEFVLLTSEERLAAGIETQRVMKRALEKFARLPAQVTINQYRSARVAPRVVAQVTARHARLGDEVEAGQRLVTLSSVELAEAQARLIIADLEWRLVSQLGKEAVSSRRYTEARVTRQQAMARVIAYGMNQSEVTTLVESGDVGSAVGSFDLLAPQAGIIFDDDFRLGEVIEAGRVIFDIVDESSMWVDARTASGRVPEVESGTPVRVLADGKWLPGTIIGAQHRVDEATRTQGLRVEVENTQHQLHAGQFAEVELSTGVGATAPVVPSQAVTLIRGVPSVFVLGHGGEFHPRSILAGDTTPEWTAVEDGVEIGEQVVVAGVFHLKSLLLKSTLGEGHAH